VTDAAAMYADLIEALSRTDGVMLGSGRPGFGAGALQVDGRIFAMLSHGRLVLKLPRERVAALVSNGNGMPFDAGKARPMKEWVALDGRHVEQWLTLAREARAFVARLP
jgi:hypothetical protein